MYAVLRHEIREESGVARPVQRLLTSSLQGGAGQGQGAAESEGSQLTAELARAMFPVLLEIYSASAGSVSCTLKGNNLLT